MTQKSPKTAFFAGSFNPFTVGHASVVDRALALFDRVVVGIGVNAAKPGSADSARERAEAVRRVYAGEPRVEVTVYTGLTVDACREAGAGFLLRGVRTVADFEYERGIADLNREISGLETVILFSLPGHGAVSSSAVRELASYGVDVSRFLPGGDRNGASPASNK